MKRRGFFKALAGLAATPAVAKEVPRAGPEDDISGLRDRLMPEITKALETGIRGYREKWTELFKLP